MITKSGLYKLLTNPKLSGVELGHEGIMELITLLQNAGFFSEGGKVDCPEVHDPWCNDGRGQPDWDNGLAYLLGEK